MILFLFKPLDIKQREFKNVPLFNISYFTMYELSTDGLTTIINGSQATRYSNRDVIKDMDYTDNTQKNLVNMKAAKGVVKDTVIRLIGDVLYFREDGLSFQIQEATYDKKSSIAKADGKFILYNSNNKVTGTHLRYNNLKNTVNSKNITVIYQLEKSINEK